MLFSLAAVMRLVTEGLLIALLLAFSHSILGQPIDWDATNFPNPTAGDFKKCNMRTTSNICDPEQILSEQQRNRIHHELLQLESRTRQDQAPDYCQKKGVSAAVAIVRHVRGGTEEAAKRMANSILRNWSLDQQCQKSIVIVLVTDDKRFWVARDAKVPVYANEFTEIFNNQKALFAAGNFDQGLLNVLRQTKEKALSKKGVPTNVGKPLEPLPPSPPQPPEKKTSGLPLWVWFLPLLLLPLLCCCCICYLCCCRGRKNNTAQHSLDPPDGRDSFKPTVPDAPTQNSGRRSGFNNFLGGLGGAGLGSLAGQFLNNQFRRGNRRPEPGAYQPGRPDDQRFGQQRNTGYRPATANDGKTEGLYPTNAINDQGGGGSWN